MSELVEAPDHILIKSRPQISYNEIAAAPPRKRNIPKFPGYNQETHKMSLIKYTSAKSQRNAFLLNKINFDHNEANTSRNFEINTPYRQNNELEDCLSQLNNIILHLTKKWQCYKKPNRSYVVGHGQ
ncbi:hypothetical protein WA026_015788 [Henosepilachna vigintioctopunctata]|uniref:Uncharacterized protein n=1 Tax=Henosepilachna vigintioctopunctata TaxID=420089 RepID=A0AAW1V1W7_9CUCU